MSQPTAPEDTWSAQKYNDVASFVYSPKYTSAVLTLLDAKPGEHIIDFGCGSGEVTLELQKIVGETGKVVGVDASQSMISKSISNGVKDAAVLDLQVFAPEYVNKFDAVFTNATLHWCKRDPKAVVENARKYLKPGGRFVGEFGGMLNCVGVRAALHVALKRRGHDTKGLDPWYFPSVNEYSKVLESSGFTINHIVLEPRPTPLLGPLVDWLDTFCRQSWLANLDDQEANEVMEEAQEICSVDCRDSDGNWWLPYYRLRFATVLKA